MPDKVGLAYELTRVRWVFGFGADLILATLWRFCLWLLFLKLCSPIQNSRFHKGFGVSTGIRGALFAIFRGDFWGEIYISGKDFLCFDEAIP